MGVALGLFALSSAGLQKTSLSAVCWVNILKWLICIQTLDRKSLRYSRGAEGRGLTVH